MKKTLLGIIGFLVIVASVNVTYAKVKATSPETAQAIKYYKSGNYTQSLVSCKKIVDKDPSNALAMYYMAMSNVQLGRREEAISAYDNVIALSENGLLGSYAKKGKRCIENPSFCHQPDASTIETWEDKFIKGSYGSGFSHDARGIHEREKIENLKREINRNEDMPPSKFKGYKDYSSYSPSNDEIVAAIRTLQRAGMSDALIGTDYGSDAFAMSDIDNSKRDYDIMNMVYMNKNRASNLNPLVIQSLLSTQTSTNF